MSPTDQPLVLKLTLRPDLRKGFVVACEDLPHLEASGNTIPEAVRNFGDAFTCNWPGIRLQLQPPSLR